MAHPEASEVIHELERVAQGELGVKLQAVGRRGNGRDGQIMGGHAAISSARLGYRARWEEQGSIQQRRVSQRSGPVQPGLGDRPAPITPPWAPAGPMAGCAMWQLSARGASTPPEDR